MGKTGRFTLLLFLGTVATALVAGLVVKARQRPSIGAIIGGSKVKMPRQLRMTVTYRDLTGRKQIQTVSADTGDSPTILNIGKVEGTIETLRITETN